MQINKDDIKGALVSLYWDDDHWTGNLDHNISRYRFNYIRDYLYSCEKLTFGHKKYPCERDGTYLGYSRMIKDLLFFKGDIMKKIDFKIIFFVANNPVEEETFVVGFYAFPNLFWSMPRRASNKLYKTYTFSNISSKVENIVQFENYLPVGKEYKLSKKPHYFPWGGDEYHLSGNHEKEGYLFLNQLDVENILEKVIDLNPGQEELTTSYQRIKDELSGKD